MKIKSIHLENFKRFTDLKISEIPKTTKLVLLIGSNGSGKSSLFDAFDWLNKGVAKGMPGYGDEAISYYQKFKDIEPKLTIELSNSNLIEKQGLSNIQGRELISKFIGRSSIRIVPRIGNNANPTLIANDLDSPQTYIENDTRFINDVFQYIQDINNALREPIFSGIQADTLKIFRDFIEPLNTSLLNIFGGDENTTIQIAEFQDATPSTTAKLIFKKGESKINYDLLSHGEKQVVILLINFIVRQEYYKDSIIFIDEMDCHLNTLLQSNLLNEILTRWIPDSSQLWTASHALGFIDFAQKNENSVIIDFDLFNFDNKIEITPESKDNLEVYEIAIPRNTISSILNGYKLVIVENKNDEYYNTALGENKYLFLPANNSREVFLTVKADNEKLGLRDRDYLRNDEIDKLQTKMSNLRILNYSTFENYIFHPNNLAELNLSGFHLDEYKLEILKQKNEKLIDIVAEIATSRSHYIEFKDCIKNDENVKPITNALESNIFEDYYPYFNMQKHFNKSILVKFNLRKSALCQTQWFKNTILEILK